MADSFERLKPTLADRYAIERELGVRGPATVYPPRVKRNRRVALIQRLSPTLVLATGMICANCTGRTADAGAWDGVERDSAGIHVVENLGGPTWADGAGWTMSEIVRIGSVGGDSDYVFGAISGLAVLSDGRIVVGDGAARELRFFSPNGVHQRTVGRRGSGPGEYNELSGVLVTPGDTLLVPDRRNLRMNRVAPDGTWLESQPVSAFEWPAGWSGTPNGLLAARVSVASYTLIGTEPVPSPVVSLTERGMIGDTLAWLRPAGFYSTLGGEQFRYYPGAPDFCLLEDGGLVTGHSADYELLRYGATNGLTHVIRLRRERLPITEREQEVFFARLKANLQERNRPQRFPQRKARTVFTETYPAFRGLVCGPRGTIWVQGFKPWTAITPEEFDRAGIVHLPPASPDWDVFDANGRYLGVVTTPTNFDIRLFRDGVAYGVWSDDLGVQYVVGLRVDGLPAEDVR